MDCVACHPHTMLPVQPNARPLLSSIARERQSLLYDASKCHNDVTRWPPLSRLPAFLRMLQSILRKPNSHNLQDEALDIWTNPPHNFTPNCLITYPSSLFLFSNPPFTRPGNPPVNRDIGHFATRCPRPGAASPF